MEVFAAMVEVLDENVGRLVEKLKLMGVYENTLILFCSDNGACPFERTRGRGLAPWDPESYWTYDASWAHAGNTPFRLYKQNQHEGGISSPLVVHWPAGLKTDPGSYTSQPGHLIDFMATFLDVGNATYPKQMTPCTFILEQTVHLDRVTGNLYRQNVVDGNCTTWRQIEQNCMISLLRSPIV